jgi:hypothetical protein
VSRQPPPHSPLHSEVELTGYRSTIFFFTEVDDPILCPITHLVSLAIADEAFDAPSLTTAKRVFEHKVWGPVLCTPLNWKQKMLKIPIFRRDERIVGSVVTSPTLALTYSQFRDCLIRLGLLVGFLLILTCYCFRRGTANVVDREFFPRASLTLLTWPFQVMPPMRFGTRS